MYDIFGQEFNPFAFCQKSLRRNMWNPQESKHEKNHRAPDSTLSSLMHDVDSYLSELNEEGQHLQPHYAPPARSHSLQEPQRQSPILANRSNTTHRTHVKYLFFF